MRVYLMVCCLVFYTVRGQVEYSIAEETERGAPVGNLVQDLGIDAARLPSRRFRMITSSSKQYFNLNVSTGALSVNERIDREEICAQEPICSLNYELVLETPLELYKLQFKILDVNDHTPTFLLEEYHVNVAEFLAPGVRFTLPVAQDLDEGINSVQSYILSPNQHFRLEMQTRGDGSRYPELVLEKPLDREQLATHRLTITAKDGGSPQRSGDAQVVVTVLDTNDNAPTFEHSVYRASVLETSPRGTLVTRVQATDLDEGQNGEVFYSFSNSTSPELQKMFSINPQNGEIKVSGALNVQKPLLEMFIEARDKGVFGMSTVSKLLVEITDVNNNAPEITLTSLSSPIPEDSLLGTVVALLSITDEDPGENGKIICKIPVDIPFQLKSSFDNYYSLITSGLLDREQPKPPNPDWRYSASLRAGMQGAVHMEETGGLRVGSGGPEQQWPTVSSATTEPEAGEVSPPVGAGVNSNSWTFKYGPGNSKQPGPNELPDKFIIPGSPAIISIRQDPPNSQTDKSDFITFGKKEETKKKKKKKKGNKAQDKKEKTNSTTDNSDQ